jgi:hypothetical protein
MLGGGPLFAMSPAQGEAKVVVAGSDHSVASITKSLTESLSFIGVTAQFERAASVNPRSVAELHPPRESLLAYLWIDAAADHDVTLYITDAATERVFVRRIGLDHGLDTVAVESLALVAQSSLEALLAGKIIGMPRDDYEHSLEVAAPPPKPAPVPVKVEPPAPSVHEVARHNLGPSRWQLSAGYQLHAWDSTTMRHEADIGIDYERWALRFSVGLFASLPIQFHSGESGAELFSNGARVSVSRPVALPRQFRLVPGLGFAIEFSRIRPELSSPDAQPASPYFAVDPILRAFLGIERSLGRWSLRGIVGLDFAIRPVRYVVTYQSDTETVRTPWRVRPFGAIVLAAGL